jgi:hypothetical protein
LRSVTKRPRPTYRITYKRCASVFTGKNRSKQVVLGVRTEPARFQNLDRELKSKRNCEQ